MGVRTGSGSDWVLWYARGKNPVATAPGSDKIPRLAKPRYLYYERDVFDMAVKVRRATKDDAEIVADFAMKLVEQHQVYDPLRFARIANLDGMKWFYSGQTDSKNAVVLVAELEGSVVGFAYVTYEEKNYVELALSAAHLHDIYIDETARHCGAGQMLIAAAVEVSKEFGASKLMLSVAEKNPVGREFFEKSGFRPTMTEMTLDLR